MKFKEYKDINGERFLIPFILGAALSAPFYGKKCCTYPYYPPYNFYNNNQYYVGPYNSFYRNNEDENRYFVPQTFTPYQYYNTNWQYGYYSPQAPYFPTPYFPIGVTGSSNTFTGQFTGQFNRDNIEDDDQDDEHSVAKEGRGNFYPLLNKYISSYLYPYFPIYCKNSPYCYYNGNPYYQSR